MENIRMVRGASKSVQLLGVSQILAADTNQIEVDFYWICDVVVAVLYGVIGVA